ncbi:SMI1/KNR4 family protein [Vibrio rhizosphaerae]|uniref:SMI1/KNR4 family protein n=1 Tax=Vibrio rhizosphaerae TaxID=398736 RepID=UPI00068B1FC2|nr:SMI1/KNR4 family protein [Vibrio rhizosphaerae]
MMINCSVPITFEDIEKFESKFNIELPVYFKKYYVSYNGGELSDNRKIFYDGNMELEINHFLPMIRDDVYKSFTVESLYEVLSINKKILPINFIPFAIDSGSFPYCINVENNNIYFFNLEKNKSIKIASDLDDLISKLYTEDEMY